MDRKNFFASNHVHIFKTDHCHTEKLSRDSRVGIFFEKKSGDKFKPQRNRVQFLLKILFGVGRSRTMWGCTLVVLSLCSLLLLVIASPFVPSPTPVPPPTPTPTQTTNRPQLVSSQLIQVERVVGNELYQYTQMALLFDQPLYLNEPLVCAEARSLVIPMRVMRAIGRATSRSLQLCFRSVSFEEDFSRNPFIFHGFFYFSFFYSNFFLSLFFSSFFFLPLSRPCALPLAAALPNSGLMTVSGVMPRCRHG